jgi:hypothetical protein
MNAKRYQKSKKAPEMKDPEKSDDGSLSIKEEESKEPTMSVKSKSNSYFKFLGLPISHQIARWFDWRSPRLTDYSF